MPAAALPARVVCRRLDHLGPIDRPGRSRVLHAHGPGHRDPAWLADRDERISATAGQLAGNGGYNSAKPIIVDVRDAGDRTEIDWIEGTFADLVVAGADAADSWDTFGAYPDSPLYVTGFYVGVRLWTVDGQLWCHRRSGRVQSANGLWAPGPCEGIDADEITPTLDVDAIARRACAEEAHVRAGRIVDVRPAGTGRSVGRDGTVVGVAVDVSTDCTAAELADLAADAADSWEADRCAALPAGQVTREATTGTAARRWLPLVTTVPPTTRR